MALVLPTDNAVIDYSIISQIIASINTLQSQVNLLTPPSVTDPNTGAVSQPRTSFKVLVQGVDAGFPAGTTSKIVVNASDLGLTSISAITGSLYSGASSRYCWLSSISSTQATFSINTSVSSGCKLHIIAVGI